MRGNNWERWSEGNQILTNIYAYPKFVWDPQNNSWTDYLFTSNASGYYIATSQVWAHITSDGMALYGGNYSGMVGSMLWSDWTNKAIASVEKDDHGVYVVQSMVSKDRSVAMNVTYAFVAGCPVKMTFSFASDRDIAGYMLGWDVGLSKAVYAVSQAEAFEVATAKSYSGTNSTYFFEDGDLAKFSMGVSWEDAWECYQGTSVGLNLMTVTFGPFDLKAGEAVVVDPLITTDLGSSGDAHVAEGSPMTNYGSATSTQVQLYKDEYGTVYRNRIFIKFDLSPLPSNVYVTSANLYLYMYASTSHFRTLAAHEVSTSWNEAAITWNNKPSYDATATTTTGAGTSAGWRCFAITSDVESAIYSGSGLVSECIKDNSETSGVPTVPYHITKQFYSEEYGTPADRPYLQVTYGLKYALIVAGAWNSSSNEVDFWNDATFLYDTLVSNYGYTDGTIYFLYADGSAPSASNCYEYDDARTTDAVIDYANTDTTLRTVFSSLASIMNSSSQLLILCATHGGDNESYSWFNVWGAGTVTDDDFVDSNHLGAITSYNREIIVMQQCHSGGFIDEMSADNRIIMTACAENENASAYLGYNYGAFDYYWISAINGAEPEPYGDPVDADANDDGKVSIYEAYDYNTDYNPYRIWEHFQWDDTSVIGESTYP